jgi:type I restriction enzyme R subunit
LQQEYDKKGNLVKEMMIFPRYHQLDVVTKLLADVKENGSGKNYLIQHSAGSGKSNSIAWLAHRLSGLHNDMDEKIFQSVIIVTDRRVLDSQLQSTVYQFDHVEGVVQKIDKNSQQLKDAIENGAGIIITTLQKFPVIYKEVNAANKRFAIIVDEAHSSQTGDAAKKLKRALADTEEILKEYAEMEEEEEKTEKTMKTVFWMNWHLRVFIKTFPSLHLLRHQRVRLYRCLGRKTQVTLRANVIDLFMYIP